MLTWTGNDQSMQMRETSRGADKKPCVNNHVKKKKAVLKEYEDKLWNLAKDKMDKETFEYMFKLILDSAKYSFNKSHAMHY